MFRRLIFDNLQAGLAVFALFASLSVFLFFIYRMVRMKKERIEYLANLPLDDEKPKPASKDDDEPRSEKPER